MSRRPIAKVLAAAGVVAFGWACAAPTLPLPPPVASARAPLNGVARVEGLAGSAVAGALVEVWNPGPAIGTIVTASADGSWIAYVPAQSGDVLDVWQSVGTERSISTNVPVP